MRDFTVYDKVMARQAASVRRAELVTRHAGAIAPRRERPRWMRFAADAVPMVATRPACCAA